MRQTSAYACGVYGRVELERSESPCQCGYTRTDVPRSASCRCKYQAQLDIVRKTPRTFYLCKMLQDRQYEHVSTLVSLTDGVSYKKWPVSSSSPGPRQSLRAAVEDAARVVYERDPDSPTYPVGQLTAVLAERCPGVRLDESCIVKFIREESDAFLDPQRIGDIEYVFGNFVNMVVSDADREATLAREMASICVGPHVHLSPDIQILRTDFVGPNIASFIPTQPIADIRQLYFAAYLGTEALRTMRLRHNDLSINNVCLQMGEERIMFGGMMWDFAFRLRFIDCGFSRMIDDLPVVSDGIIMNKPSKLADLGLHKGMPLKRHMDVCYYRSGGDVTGYHFRTVPWLCEHPFIDALQFLTQLRVYVHMNSVHRACLDDLIDLLDDPGFESHPLRTRLARAAKCCSVPLSSCSGGAAAVTDRDRMIASSMRRSRSADRGDDLRAARAAKRQRNADDA